MPILEVGPGSQFSRVLVAGLRPQRPSLFQEVLERLNALGVSAQLMDSRGVAGLEHLATAAKMTAISFAAGRNLARSPATEFLLYASATRQIKEAIERLGVNSRSRSWVLVTISDSAESLRQSSELFSGYGTIDDRAMEMAPSKRAHLMELYDISPGELSLALAVHGDRDSALKALVLERVALSDLYR